MTFLDVCDKDGLLDHAKLQRKLEAVKEAFTVLQGNLGDDFALNTEAKALVVASVFYYFHHALFRSINKTLKTHESSMSIENALKRMVEALPVIHECMNDICVPIAFWAEVGCHFQKLQPLRNPSVSTLQDRRARIGTRSEIIENLRVLATRLRNRIGVISSLALILDLRRPSRRVRTAEART